MSVHSTNIKVDFHSIKRVCYLVANFEIEVNGEWYKVEGRAEINPEHHDLYMDLKQLLFDAAQDAIQNYNNDSDTEQFIDVSMFDTPEKEASSDIKTSIKPENIYDKIDTVKGTKKE